MTPEAWNDPEERLLALRRAAPVEGGVELSLLLINGSDEDEVFHLPTPGFPWRAVLDSAEPQARDRVVEGATEAVERYSARLLVAFVAREDTA
jgi:glycogen operon protein